MARLAPIPAGFWDKKPSARDRAFIACPDKSSSGLERLVSCDDCGAPIGDCDSGEPRDGCVLWSGFLEKEQLLCSGCGDKRQKQYPEDVFVTVGDLRSRAGLAATRAARASALSGFRKGARLLVDGEEYVVVGDQNDLGDEGVWSANVAHKGGTDRPWSKETMEPVAEKVREGWADPAARRAPSKWELLAQQFGQAISPQLPRRLIAGADPYECSGCGAPSGASHKRGCKVLNEQCAERRSGFADVTFGGCHCDHCDPEVRTHVVLTGVEWDGMFGTPKGGVVVAHPPIVDQDSCSVVGLSKDGAEVPWRLDNEKGFEWRWARESEVPDERPVVEIGERISLSGEAGSSGFKSRPDDLVHYGCGKVFVKRDDEWVEARWP